MGVPGTLVVCAYLVLLVQRTDRGARNHDRLSPHFGLCYCETNWGSDVDEKEEESAPAS